MKTPVEKIEKELRDGVSLMSDVKLKEKITEIRNCMWKHNHPTGFEIGYLIELEDELKFREKLNKCAHKNQETGSWGTNCNDCGIKL